MPASVPIAMEEDGTNALLPRNSAITISFFYCTVNHPTERGGGMSPADAHCRSYDEIAHSIGGGSH
eukprot:scaffold306717_cov33-Attheya_sp.AAC.1